MAGAAAVAAAAACGGGADTPKRSRMFGVLLSAAEPPVGGSGAAAKGLVAFCLSYKNTKYKNIVLYFFKNLQLELCNIPPGKLKRRKNSEDIVIFC